MKKISILLIITIFLYGCRQPDDRDLNKLMEGTWNDINNKHIWQIDADSVFYFSEKEKYFYILHENDMIVFYKNGPYQLKNLEVKNDTLSYKTSNLNIKMMRDRRSLKPGSGETYSKIDPAENRELVGKWSYKTAEGNFSWTFNKDSVNYLNLGKTYYYFRHKGYIIALTQSDPIVMKDVLITKDTLVFETGEGVRIRAVRIH